MKKTLLLMPTKSRQLTFQMWSTSSNAETEDKEAENLKVEEEDPEEKTTDPEEKKMTDLEEMMTGLEEMMTGPEEMKIDPEEIDKIRIDSTTEEKKFPEEDMTETMTAEEIEMTEEEKEKKEDTERTEDPEKTELVNMLKREKVTTEERENPSAGPSLLTSALLMMASIFRSKYIFCYIGSFSHQNRRTFNQVQMCHC